MIGCHDFCGHYEWTFQWLKERGGEDLVRTFWNEAIGHDSQIHAKDLITRKGFQGMAEYWSHTLVEEAAGYVASSGPDVFRVDINDCPSKGFLLRNGLRQYHDYCDHCMGWIGPVMKEAGFKIHHEHNHCGKCWWEFRKHSSRASDVGTLAGANDVRLDPNWASGKMDVFEGVTSPLDKSPATE